MSAVFAWNASNIGKKQIKTRFTSRISVAVYVWVSVGAARVICVSVSAFLN